MIKIEAIDHIVLRVSDLARMLDFYCGVLGCELERELPELGLTQLRAGEALIDLVTVSGELGKAGGRAPAAEGRNLDHLCLRITETAEEDLTCYLESRGVAVPGFAKRYGAQGFGQSVYIEDPEGNMVELKFAVSNRALSSENI